MKFCIFTPYDDLYSSCDDYGGSEKQIKLISKLLVEHGHTVYLISLSGSVQVISPTGHVPYFSVKVDRRYKFSMRVYRVVGFVRELIKLDADVYYIRGISWLNILMYLVSKLKGKFTICALSSDLDLEKVTINFRLSNASSHNTVRSIFMHHLYRLIIPRYSAVFCQNFRQISVCREIGCNATRVRSIFLNDLDTASASRISANYIYVGNISERKGISELERIIGLSTAFDWTIIGGLQTDKLKEVLQRISNKPYVQYCGKMGYRETMNMLACSRALINTSPTEGFPNTFLEAWALGVPVISLTVNPDGLLTGGGRLGFCARGSIIRIMYYIYLVHYSDSIRYIVGERGRRYVQHYHSPGSVYKSIANTLTKISKSGHT